jgi:argonaute-like protein implicated in RNA metabolism and viral defense
MLLTFHTLAASLRSKTPLPVYMPSARAARSKLMNHRRSDVKKTNWVKFRNLTWFAMACSSEEMIDELEYLTNLIRYIVGESEYADRAKRIDDFVNYSAPKE